LTKNKALARLDAFSWDGHVSNYRTPLTDITTTTHIDIKYKFCPKCGTKLTIDTAFCGSCGTALS